MCKTHFRIFISLCLLFFSFSVFSEIAVASGTCSANCKIADCSIDCTNSCGRACCKCLLGEDGYCGCGSSGIHFCGYDPRNSCTKDGRWCEGSSSTSYDRDYSQEACTASSATCTPYYWNIGGEYIQPSCCGDDFEHGSGEYRLISTGIGSDGTDACCDTPTDCVFNNNCYTNGANHPTNNCIKCLYGDWVAKSTSTQCNSNYKCCPGQGDNNYRETGGNYRCQGYCDGSGNCDYAGNCGSYNDDWYEDVDTDPFQCSGHDYAYVSKYQYRDYICNPAGFYCNVKWDAAVTGVNVPGWSYGKTCCEELGERIGKAYGKNVGMVDYDPIADLTGPTAGVPDGKVDSRDLAFWGSKCYTGDQTWCIDWMKGRVLSRQVCVEHPARPRNLFDITDFAMTGDSVHILVSVYNSTPTKVYIRENGCSGMDYCTCEPKPGRLGGESITWCESGSIYWYMPALGKCVCTMSAPVPFVEHPEYYYGGIRQTFNFYVCVDENGDGYFSEWEQVPFNLTVHSMYAPLGITESIRQFLTNLLGGQK